MIELFMDPLEKAVAVKTGSSQRGISHANINQTTSIQHEPVQYMPVWIEPSLEAGGGVASP